MTCERHQRPGEKRGEGRRGCYPGWRFAAGKEMEKGEEEESWEKMSGNWAEAGEEM